MRLTIVAAGLALTVLVSACASAGPVSPEPGAAVPVTPEPDVALYSPLDRDALAFGLPDLVQGKRLVASPPDVIEAVERNFAYDLAVRRLLVQRALGSNAVTIEHKGDTFREMPDIAVSAVQIRNVPAEQLIGFDPSFYLLLTSITRAQWEWVGDKPGPEPATVAGREVWISRWTESGFQVAWYTLGDVLYIVMASNEQLLSDAMRQMPGSSAAA